MEDIINRGGGDLKIQLFCSTLEEEVDPDKEVVISIDGVRRKLPPGGIVTLTPGESITLPPYIYHEFYGEGDRVLVGEVSLVNDDHRDNRFANPVGRFPVIEEDEAPLHLLVNDYERYCQIPYR
jgi:D-lyxose ketol-isomerase